MSKDGARQIFDASNNVITAQWSTISDTIVANTDGYVVIGVGRIEAGTQVTGFGVQTASKVYDTRIAQARVDYDKRILALTEFPQGKDDLQGMVDQIDAGLKANDMSALGTDIEDESAMSDLINGLSSLERTYLDANSFDLVNGKLDDEGTVVTAAVMDAGSIIKVTQRSEMISPDPTVCPLIRLRSRRHCLPASTSSRSRLKVTPIPERR